MFDIVALGESLIDFTPSGENSQGMALFARNPGGAPANVLAMAAKLGGKTAFIGKVGDDAFGAFLKKTMEDAGVDVRGLRMTREYPTTLAFVQLTPEGDRSFTFYRKPGADVMLAPAEVDRALLRDCRIFHFGSVSLTDEPCRTATLEAAREAKAAGAMISYDPNYRPFLWDSAERAREALLAALPLADIVKVSEEEMELLTGEVQLAAGADALASRDAEQEHILVAHALTNLDICAVECAERDRAIDHQLHVAGTGGLLTRNGDLLGQVGSRDDDLGQRDFIVFNEDHLELVLHLRVGVHKIGNGDDERNDLLGQIIACGGLGREDECLRIDRLFRVILDIVVKRQDMQDIQQLPLVFMQALDLHVEDRIRPAAFRKCLHAQFHPGGN